MRILKSFLSRCQSTLQLDSSRLQLAINIRMWTTVHPFLKHFHRSHPWLWQRHHRPIISPNTRTWSTTQPIHVSFQKYCFAIRFNVFPVNAVISFFVSFGLSIFCLSVFCNFAFLLTVATVRSCLCFFFFRLPFHLADVPSESCAIAIAVLRRRRRLQWCIYVLHMGIVRSLFGFPFFAWFHWFTMPIGSKSESINFSPHTYEHVWLIELLFFASSSSTPSTTLSFPSPLLTSTFGMRIDFICHSRLYFIFRLQRIVLARQLTTWHWQRITKEIFRPLCSIDWRELCLPDGMHQMFFEKIEWNCELFGPPNCLATHFRQYQQPTANCPASVYGLRLCDSIRWCT